MIDTPPQVARVVRERLMALSGAERFIMGTQMFEAARRMVLASFPPGLTETERKRRLFERIYGEQLPSEITSEASARLGGLPALTIR